MILTQILTPQNLKWGCYKYGRSMSVYEVAHTIFLEVKTHAQEGNTTEVLKCIDRKQGLFKLLTRKPDTKIPMSSIVLRHNKFPLGCTVRLKRRPIVVPSLDHKANQQQKLLLPPLDR